MKAEVQVPADTRTILSPTLPSRQRLTAEHRLLDVLGAPQQFLAGFGQRVAGLRPHEERLADLLFERGDPASQRCRAQPGRCRRGRQPAQPRHIEKQPQVVPARSILQK